MNKSKNTKSKALVSRQGNKLNKLVAGAVGVAAVAGVSGYGIGTVMNQDIQDFEPVYTVSTQELKLAKSALSSLAVRSGVENITGYDSSMMPGWSDVDNDGCPTRYDVLTRDIINEKTDEAHCKIESGTMFDYYTGTLVKYNRHVSGGGIDIDHVVAKGNAWISGGYTWNNEQWKAYINDEDVLMATSTKANRSKGDKDAAGWLPSNEKFWCKYVIKQIQIKDKYGLSVSVDEKSIIENILSTNCNKNWED